MTKNVKLTFDQAVDLIQLALIKHGASKTDSLSVAKALVSAEAAGQIGHGFARVESYINQLKTGKINPQAKIKVSHPFQASTLIDADSGFAYPALDLAVKILAKKANQFGIASLSITHSNHCGSLGIQVEKLANKGLIAIMLANTPKAMAPWGAKKAIFGTNPIAFATPRKDKPPLIIDLSLSKVARGKIVNAEQLGQKIPKGWALDKNGNDTENPKDGLNGTMLPIAQAKGSALALMVEILAAVHGGANLSFNASSFFDSEGKAPNVGQFLIAIKPGQENNPNSFYLQLESLLTTISQLDGTRLPGESTQAIKQKSENQGIFVEAHYIKKIKQLT